MIEPHPSFLNRKGAIDRTSSIAPSTSIAEWRILQHAYLNTVYSNLLGDETLLCRAWGGEARYSLKTVPLP